MSFVSAWLSSRAVLEFLNMFWHSSKDEDEVGSSCDTSVSNCEGNVLVPVPAFPGVQGLNIVWQGRYAKAEKFQLHANDCQWRAGRSRLIFPWVNCPIYE